MKASSACIPPSRIICHLFGLLLCQGGYVTCALVLVEYYPQLLVPLLKMVQSRAMEEAKVRAFYRGSWNLVSLCCGWVEYLNA